MLGSHSLKQEVPRLTKGGLKIILAISTLCVGCGSREILDAGLALGLDYEIRTTRTG